jgi:hypothetical protein
MIGSMTDGQGQAARQARRLHVSGGAATLCSNSIPAEELSVSRLVRATRNGALEN